MPVWGFLYRPRADSRLLGNIQILKPVIKPNKNARTVFPTGGNLESIDNSTRRTAFQVKVRFFLTFEKSGCSPFGVLFEVDSMENFEELPLEQHLTPRFPLRGNGRPAFGPPEQPFKKRSEKRLKP